MCSSFMPLPCLAEVRALRNCMSVEDVETRIQQLQPKARAGLL